MEIGEHSKYAWRHILGIVMSPSGHLSIGLNRGLGFARCFSGDDDRMEFPWPYDAEGKVSREYDEVWLPNKRPAQAHESVEAYLTDEAVWYLSPEPVTNMVSYSVVDDPEIWSGNR